MIDPGKVWPRVEEVSSREFEKALESVSTTCEVFEEDGIPYQLRVLHGVHPKKQAKHEQKITGRNPFLPPEEALLVGVLSSTHTTVLNKFNVFGGHLLIITRDFVPQDGLLTNADFDALVAAMSGVDGLGFYNAGPVAGASQPHRHLQVAPLPLLPATEDLPTPIDAAIKCGRSLPFAYALAELSGAAFERSQAPELFEMYLSMVAAQGLSDGKRPYNLLLTQRWMMVVPRFLDRFERVSINALGFAGSLLVRDNEILQRIKALGPGEILRAVTGQ